MLIYHKPGPLSGSNDEILCCLHFGDYSHNTLYSVRHLCCGHVTELTHKQLAERIRRSRKFCPQCPVEKRNRAAVDAAKKVTRKKGKRLFKATAELPKGVTPPLWQAIGTRADAEKSTECATS